MALTPNNSSLDKAAKAKAAEAEVFQREVDEALRQDRMETFFKRYGVLIAAVVVLILAGLGGYFYWQHAQTKAREVQAETLIKALDSVDSGNLKDADTQLDALAAKTGDSTGVAAKLMQADIALQQGHASDAVKLYDAVAADAKAPQTLRDLAAVRSVSANYDSLKPQQVIDRLKPLAVPGNPWFGSAGELVASAYLAQGKKDQAGPLFAAIAKDDSLPDSLRNRTRQIAATLGVDAVDDVVDAEGQPLTGATTSTMGKADKAPANTAPATPASKAAAQ